MSNKKNFVKYHLEIENKELKQKIEQLEKQIETLKNEARELKIRLSCIEDQISDFVGDLRMLENDTKQNS